MLLWLSRVLSVWRLPTESNFKILIYDKSIFNLIFSNELMNTEVELDRRMLDFIGKPKTKIN